MFSETVRLIPYRHHYTMPLSTKLPADQNSHDIASDNFLEMNHNNSYYICSRVRSEDESTVFVSPKFGDRQTNHQDI